MTSPPFSIIVPALLFCLVAASADARSLARTAQQAAGKTIDIRRSTQRAEDRWAEEKSELSARLETLEARRNDLLREKKVLEEKIAAAETRVADKERQVKEISRIAEEIHPFLQDLVERLEQQIEADTPFLLSERKGRLVRLRKMLSDPGAPVSEMLRKVLEAYLVETEYGNTIEVYQEHLTLEGKSILANVFRLGRISLFCQTLDGRRVGFFDAARGAWTVFPDGYEREIRMALEIGGKQRPADLLSLPVGRIVAP